MKGELNIKIYDKQGNLKQEENGHNLITNYYKDFLNAKYNIVNNAITGRKPDAMLSYMNKIVENSKGILLFGNTLVENPDNYTEQLIKATEIGHAGNIEISGSNKQGLLNIVEDTTTGIKYQWIFGENKAVGTIKSVGLCNTTLGNYGIQDKDLFYTQNKTFYKRQNVNLPLAGDFTCMNDSNEIINIFGIYNNVLYGYIFTEGTEESILKIYSYNLNDITNISSTFQPFYLYDDYYKNTKLVMNLYKEISLDYNSLLKDYKLRKINIINGRLYCFLSNQSYSWADLYCLNGDIESDDFVYNTIDISGKASCGQWNTLQIGISYKNNKLFILGSDEKTLQQYSLSAFNFEQTINLQIDEFKTFDDSDYISLKYINQYNDDYFIIGNYGWETTIQIGYLTDGTAFKTYFYNSDALDFIYHNKMSFIFKSSKLQSFFCDLGLFTIKNLSGDVIKNASDTMVVTYRLLNN